MSISYTLVSESNELTKDLLLTVLKELHLECDEPVKLKRGIEINQFCDILGFTVYLLNAGVHPYNAVDFEYLNKEFKYSKSLSFNFNKDFENSDIQWKSMLDIIFSLMNKLNSNAVFSFEFDMLYCLFSKNHKLFINNNSSICKNKYFRENTIGWECVDIKENTIVEF